MILRAHANLYQHKDDIIVFKRTLLWLFVQTSPALAIKGLELYDGLTIYTTHTHTAKTHVNMRVYKRMQAWSVNYIPIHMVYVYVGMRVIHFVIYLYIYIYMYTDVCQLHSHIL